MEKVVLGSEMQRLDRVTIEAGIPSLVLMENAARGAVDVLVEWAGVPSRCWIVCGKGNNGGDGLAMARHLHNRGSEVEVLLICKPTELQGDVATNFAMLHSLPIALHASTNAAEISEWLGRRPEPDVLIDAILGTGLKSAPRGPALVAIESISSHGSLRIFSVDLPSGLAGDSPLVPGLAVKAEMTATFGLAKVPHFVQPSAQHCGQVRVVEISIPRALLTECQPAYHVGSPPTRWIPPREVDSHKGNFGRLLIVAGSVGMTGAACLAARAAVRGGAGLVTVATPENVHTIIEAKTTESMSLPLPVAQDGGLSPDSLSILLDQLSGSGTELLLGPGLGTQPSTVEVVNRLVEVAETRIVLDADGLNCFAREGNVESRLAQRRATTILTPHPGEMRRLLRRTVVNRLEDAREFASRSRSVVILKGAGSIVTNGSQTFVVGTGNPGMATGGSGDVLAGLLGALMAQGLPAWHASVLGAYLHGLAGDCAAEAYGEEALSAGDVVQSLPEAWQRWQRQN